MPHTHWGSLQCFQRAAYWWGGECPFPRWGMSPPPRTPLLSALRAPVFGCSGLAISADPRCCRLVPMTHLMRTQSAREDHPVASAVLIHRLPGEGYVELPSRVSTRDRWQLDSRQQSAVRENASSTTVSCRFVLR